MNIRNWAPRQWAAWLVMVALGGVGGVAHGEGLDAGLTNPGYEEQPSWFKLSFLDMREDVSEAAAHDKRVLLFFYQDGCPYCKKLLEDNFAQRDIVRTTRKHFDVIALNIWGSREVTDFKGRVMPEKEFAARLRVQFTPTLLFLDEHGRAALRINGYYPPHKFRAALAYVAAHMETKMPFRQYYEQHNPEPATGKLHQDPGFLQPPYNLTRKARASGKYLMVLFEQRQCKDCDYLHLNILQRKRSRAELRHFDTVLLDMWSDTPVITPGGERTTAARWARKLNVQYAPTMVFFDPAGKEVFRAEAYLRAFHVQGSMAYVYTGGYRTQPNFQRFLRGWREELEKQGEKIDLWK